MFFAAEHYTNIKIMNWVESAMESAILIQYGLAKGNIQTCHYKSMLESVAFKVTKQIIKEKCILRCEPSVN